MTYPLSNEVVAGQATEAIQYNNLRADAVFLGAEDMTASGTVRDLLIRAMGEMPLTQIGKNTISLPASESNPASLMIEGSIYSVYTSLSLTLSSAEISAAGRYSIYAVAETGGRFSLDYAAGTSRRAIGTFLWDGLGIIPGSVRTISDYELMQKFNTPAAAHGRLTLVPGNPVPEEDITQSTDLYFVPYNGCKIGLYFDGWEYFSFGILSLSRNGLTAGIPYDIFLKADSEGLQLVSMAWGSSDTRAAGSLAWVDGVRVSGSDSTLRFIGTVILNDAGYFEDSKAGRLVWNENNRISRPILAKLITSKTQGAVHNAAWAPYYDEDCPFVRLIVPGTDCEFELDGVGLSSPISESDRSYQRCAAVGILKDPMTESPYTNNDTCVPVYTHTYGNGPIQVKIENHDTGFIGYHRYFLGFWTNYSFYPIGTNINSLNESPGLYGSIKG